MLAAGTIEAVDAKRRLAALALVDGQHAVVEWTGAANLCEGDVVQGRLDSVGSDYLEDRTQHRLVRVNVRFLGCNPDVALSLVDSQAALW